VLVVVGVVGFLLFGRGGGGALGGHGQGNVGFSFTLGKVTALPTTSTEKKTLASAQRAAVDVTRAMSSLYEGAFLEPGNWRDGSYDDVWSLFTGGAQGAAQGDAPTLTVGSRGGDTYSSIDRPRGRIEVRVLLNAKDQPATAVALARFSAVGTRTDGKVTLFRSSGQFFLRPGGDGWRIYSFHVDRDDSVTEPSPTPSGSATPGAS
jgi:hypothetical protein